MQPTPDASWISTILDFLEIPNNVGDRVQVISAFVALIAAVIAVAGAIIAYIQIRSAKKIQRESLALQVYDDYLKLCLAEPALACGEWEAADGKLPKDLLRERYEWFVAIMLNACDRIIVSKPNDEEWKKTIKLQLLYHKSYLQGKGRQYADCYSGEMRKFIDEVFRPGPPSSEIGAPA